MKEVIRACDNSICPAVMANYDYIAMQSRDEIQTWLAASWWRQIPDGESDVPAIWPTMQMEMSQLQQLVDGGK